jgi:hypothetical protein
MIKFLRSSDPPPSGPGNKTFLVPWIEHVMDQFFM